MEKLSLKKYFLKKKKKLTGEKETIPTKLIQISSAGQVHPLPFYFFKKKKKLAFN